MKLVSWNVNSLKARMPRLVELLEAHRPDLVLLQETKCEPDAFPELELNGAGYHALHHGSGRWAGVALAAPQGVELGEARAGLADEPARDEARWLEATAHGIRFASVYVPNGRELGSPFYEDKLRCSRPASWTPSASCTPTSPASPGGTTGRGTSTASWACARRPPALAVARPSAPQLRHRPRLPQGPEAL